MRAANRGARIAVSRRGPPRAGTSEASRRNAGMDRPAVFERALDSADNMDGRRQEFHWRGAVWVFFPPAIERNILAGGAPCPPGRSCDRRVRLRGRAPKAGARNYCARNGVARLRSRKRGRAKAFYLRWLAILFPARAEISRYYGIARDDFASETRGGVRSEVSIRYRLRTHRIWLNNVRPLLALSLIHI